MVFCLEHDHFMVGFPHLCQFIGGYLPKVFGIIHHFPYIKIALWGQSLFSDTPKSFLLKIPRETERLFGKTSGFMFGRLGSQEHIFCLHITIYIIYDYI